MLLVEKVIQDKQPGLQTEQIVYLNMFGGYYCSIVFKDQIQYKY
ncbi:hypothetical protein HanPSC8_Chr01g0034581 [Helianthus annuus]|nr:hypothetical protein HanPSC8_Chr01g0034581 [Helianthus annuus]